MNIIFWGDIMPGGIFPYIDTDPLTEEIQDLVKNANLVVGTLECAIGDELDFDPEKMKGRANIIYSPTAASLLLCRMQFDIVSLANNHIFDLGLDGLNSTVQFLQANNIQYTGAGKNIKEALKPVVIEKEGLRIAFIAGCTYDANQVAYVPIATKKNFGIAPLEGKDILLQIKKYKKICDYVIILAHWGREYNYFPLKASKVLAKEFIRAGADLIIGSHPHVVQPKITLNKKDVYFSLGNGVFPDFLMNVPRPIWYPDPNNIEISSIQITNDYPYPIEKPLLRKWPKRSRIGMIVTSSVSKTEIHSSYKYIELLENKSLQRRRKVGLSLKLNCIGVFINTSIYDEGLWIRRLRNILYRIKKKLIN